MLFSLDGIQPKVHETAFIAPNAVLIGDVEVQANASIWFGCVLRGDAGKILIGEGSAIQDNTVMHDPITIGKNSTIGHLCLLHLCEIGENVLIANGALIVGPAEIGDGSVIGAGAVIVPRTIVPPNTLMLGVPAKSAGSAEKYDLIGGREAKWYQNNRTRYLKGLAPVGGWDQWLKMMTDVQQE